MDLFVKYMLLVLLGLIAQGSAKADELDGSGEGDLKEGQDVHNETAVEEANPNSDYNHKPTISGTAPLISAKKRRFQRYFDDVLDLANHAIPRNILVYTATEQIPPETSPSPVSEIVTEEKRKKSKRCRETIREAPGFIMSPLFPNMAESDEDCQWKISATPGERLILNITHLQIFQEESCQHNFIEIQDGFGHKSKTIGKVCGRSPGTELLFTAGFRMTIIFRTSRHHSGLKAFKANFIAVCGGDIESEEGGISSPNYPDLYKPHLICIWNITVPVNHHVVLTFDFFELEYSDQCEFDYLTVHDGHAFNHIRLGKFCGKRVPKEVHSNSNNMMVKFASDNSVQETGFSATFSKDFDECTAGVHECEHECINTVGSYICSCPRGFKLKSDRRSCEAVCGGNIFDASDIQTPNYPDHYIPDIRCVWKVNFSDSAQVLLKFHTFKLEYQQNCQHDYVEVRSGTDRHNKLLGRYCGRCVPEQLLAPTNQLLITFVSDGSFQEEGFLASISKEYDECKLNRHSCEHECVNSIGSFRCECREGYALQPDGRSCEAICGGSISGDNGLIIYAPNSTEENPAAPICVWKITVPILYKAAMKIADSLANSSDNCHNSNLEIHEGFGSSSRLLGKYSCDNLTDELVSSTNQMMIKLTPLSNSAIFSAHFLKEHDECKSNQHKCDYRCVNVIGSYRCECQAGYSLQPDGKTCKDIDECSENKHDCQQSCTNTAGGYQCTCPTGQLLSDHKSCWQCGGALKASKTARMLTSHAEFGSTQYLNRQECTWRITSSRGHRVQVSVTDINLEPHQSCNFDYLQIANGDGRVWKKICGVEVPPRFISTSNGVIITFHSDEGTTSRGFSLLYEEL